MRRTVRAAHTGADGAVLTPGTNTDFDTVLATGGAVTVSTTELIPGLRSLRSDGGTSGGASYVAETFADSPRVSAQIPFRVNNAYPTGDANVISLWGAADWNTRGMTLQLTNTGTLRARDAGGGGGTPMGTPPTAALALNDGDYVIILFADRVAGTFKSQVWRRGAATPVANSLQSWTAKNLGAIDFTALRAGSKTSTSSIGLSINVGDVIIDTVATDLMAPSWLVAPVVPETPAQAAGVWVDLSGVVFSGGQGGTFSAVPATGVRPGPGGIFLPSGPDPITYTVTVTDTATTVATSRTVEVASTAEGGGATLKMLTPSGWV